ncbi:hypothetical protein GGR57DRAFT_474577 [Xylariaceae sp. FL1272]|nr:hypothetical protein GGR57DRAFT_474577 [Xylariaceae sp. FL1272]
MDDSQRLAYEAKASKLRAELKRFEADWATSHHGRKPGRLEIKEHPDVAGKYKAYNQLRDILAGKRLPNTASKSASNKRPAHDSDHGEGLSQAQTQTPSKRHCRPDRTPSNARTADLDHAALATPSTRLLFSPAMPTSIGPTPQRNGRILGIFDLLDENVENADPDAAAAVIGPTHAMSRIQATPSKRTAGAGDNLMLERTPMSVSKRNMLDSFATPLKSKGGNALGVTTPSSVSKLQLSTPAFLRRAPMQTLHENARFAAGPAPLRLPRKPLGRSLSSVVAGLRRLEDDKFDDDLEALHQMENDATSTQPAPLAKVMPKTAAEILEPDSQSLPLLGGFDDESLYDSPAEEGKEHDGRPLRVYRKKGQKRTTRRVNMKPTRVKRQPQSLQDAVYGISGHESGGDDVIPETQRGPEVLAEGPGDVGSDLDSNLSEDERDQHQEDKVLEEQSHGDKKEGKMKKAVKKVNELAHTNFKRLKLRNSGSKGGPGFGSRFRRRR